MSKLGLDDLVETLATVAEVREVRAEREGVRCEARIIESRVERGRGNVATVLVTRGSLRTGQVLMSGTVHCKVRQMLTSSGSVTPEALPGQPIEITGWKELPAAGDEVLEAGNEKEAIKAIEGRQRRKERLQLIEEVEVINEKTKTETEAHNQVLAQKAMIRKRKANFEYISKEDLATLAALEEKATNVIERGLKSATAQEVLLIVKADYHGTLEAVTGALAGIGNKEARAKVIHSAVGDISVADVEMAQAVKGMGIYTLCTHLLTWFNYRCGLGLQRQSTQIHQCRG